MELPRGKKFTRMGRSPWTVGEWTRLRFSAVVFCSQVRRPWFLRVMTIPNTDSKGKRESLWAGLGLWRQGATPIQSSINLWRHNHPWVSFAMSKTSYNKFVEATQNDYDAFLGDVRLKNILRRIMLNGEGAHRRLKARWSFLLARSSRWWPQPARGMQSM